MYLDNIMVKCIGFKFILLFQRRAIAPSCPPPPNRP